MKVHFSSLRLDWKTPKAVYQVLDAEFQFDFDPCPVNPKKDGLSIPWGESNYCNPGSNCLRKSYNIHRNRLKTLAFYY